MYKYQVLKCSYQMLEEVCNKQSVDGWELVAYTFESVVNQYTNVMIVTFRKEVTVQ